MLAHVQKASLTRKLGHRAGGFGTFLRRLSPLFVVVVLVSLASPAAQAATSAVKHHPRAHHRAQAASDTGNATSEQATEPGSGIPSYWVDASNGGVFAYGGAGFYGSAGNIHLNEPMVGMSATANDQGYWLVASDGGIFSYGDAVFHGSAGDIHLNQPVVGMATTANGGGYWLVASDGGIFSYGDAGFHGSTGGIHLNAPVVGMAPTSNGQGYWLVASDGGVFCFGNAGFHGSTGDIRLNAPIVGMAPTPNGQGYWLIASDGGVFAFGNAQFYGSLGDVTLTSPITGVAATPDGGGYWFTSADGTVFAFGDANYFGSATDSVAKVVGIAEGTGSGYAAHDSGYPSGAYGSDVSNWQCSGPLPSGHTIGIVEVAGWSFGSVNPCLASEVAWAGSGLELYTFVTYGTQASGPSICAGNVQCNYGFEAAQHAYSQAKTAGIDADVAWWLDVEAANGAWSSNPTDNAGVVRGAILGLQEEGLQDVGIYSNISEWKSVTGGSNFSPFVPEWVADWGINKPPFSPFQYCSGYNFAKGPTWLVQYTNGSNTNKFDDDYAC
jgi:hypothetical protein